MDKPWIGDDGLTEAERDFKNTVDAAYIQLARATDDAPMFFLATFVGMLFAWGIRKQTAVVRVKQLYEQFQRNSRN